MIPLTTFIITSLCIPCFSHAFLFPTTKSKASNQSSLPPVKTAISPAFYHQSRPHRAISKPTTSIFAATEDGSSTEYKIEALEGDDSSIKTAANFMIDAFWLQPPQILEPDTFDDISDSARSRLIEDQIDDLRDRYGERFGKRLLNSCLITATGDLGDGNNPTILGVVGIEVALLDKGEESILNMENSENMINKAVASVGPKQRRIYKDSSVSEIVTALLPPEMEAVVVLSNLAVSPKARRMGLGSRLCLEAERIAKDEWEFDKMFLKVEAANAAARGLYEGSKMGYKQIYSDENAMGLRVDTEAGEFVDFPAETLTLAKDI